MKTKAMFYVIVIMILMASLVMIPVLATDTSTGENSGNGPSVDCPADNGNGNAYGAWEHNWKCIPQAFSEVENLTIDSMIVEGTPHWIFLAAGTQEKQALLNYIDNASVPKKQKDEWTQFVRTMWKEHPVGFDNSTGNPMLVLGKSSDRFTLTPEENATFKEIERYIAEDMDNVQTGKIIVRWYQQPTHEQFMQIALDNEDLPKNLKSDAIKAAPEPDTWPINSIPSYQQINHGYVPGIGGLAPDNFGFYANTAKLMYISHDYSGAFTNMGYASHYMTDLGNPYHTPMVQIIPLEFIDMPFSQIVFPNSQMILNYKTLHDNYEGMVADHWGMFYNGNQERYDIYDPTSSARAHGTYSWAMSYPLIYNSYWHFINNHNLDFETNSAIVGITQNRVVESMKNTRGLVRYVTGGHYPTLTVTATAGPGGSISPSGAVSVKYDETQTFTITPSSGYVINDVKVDGVSQGVKSSYLFTNVRADHTISATFRQDQSSIIPLVRAGTHLNALKYPQNWPQSDPMTFQCNWDGNGRVYISGDQSALTSVRADDGFIITIQPSGATFDAQPHYACAHNILELTSGMRPGVNSFTLIVKNWQGLSMSYGSINGYDTDQTPYIIQVNSPKMAAAVDKTSTDELPSFIIPDKNGFVINGTFIDTTNDSGS